MNSGIVKIVENQADLSQRGKFVRLNQNFKTTMDDSLASKVNSLGFLGTN